MRICVLATLPLLIATACGGEDPPGAVIDLGDHLAPLTASGELDELFEVEIFELEAAGVPLESISFSIRAFDGELTTFASSTVIQDGGSDDVLGPGDVLVAVETDAGDFGPSDSGRLFIVQLFTGEACVPNHASGEAGDDDGCISELQWVGDGGLGLR